MPTRPHARRTISRKRSPIPPKPSYHWSSPYVFGVVTARILGAFFMFVSPWWGLMLSYFLDTVDCWFLMQKAGYNREMYHTVDKWLDWVCYAVEYVLMWRTPFFALSSAMLAWRLIGQLIFHRTKRTWQFILFPNFFEIVYMWGIAAPTVGLTYGLSTDANRNCFIVLCVAKLFHEAWLHLIWPNHLKKNGFPTFLRPFGYHNVGY